ncbi:MAG: toxin-antitoxin system antidote component [Algoriphagus marincola HL-49]|uniref:Toxin-antitoxin system antidote component n=1 Tax=Algoriphagus marincola HL-49 TaxID=1305737 RepID=A0A0P8BVC6_9BACT|nr:MAG: toxin-antitoxin system antidote component [Algoriphagus marincola HL-49]
MEQLLIKVDTKENGAFLRELLQKFNFVVEIEQKTEEVQNSTTIEKNVGGALESYGDKEKVKEESSIWESVVKLKHGVH